MPSVTIAGAGGQAIVLNYNAAANAGLAAQLTSAIGTGVVAGTNSVAPQAATSVQSSYGSETIAASGASGEQVQGGTANALFIGGSDVATIAGAAGNTLPVADAATLTGGGENNWLAATGAANQTLIAGSFNATLTAALSGGNDLLQAGSGNDVLIGGSGADTFSAGSGNATVVAGTGSDVFAFINGHAGGNMVVEGLAGAAAVQIDLLGYSASDVAFALANVTVAGGSLTIELSDNTIVTFQNVTSVQSLNSV